MLHFRPSRSTEPNPSQPNQSGPENGPPATDNSAAANFSTEPTSPTKTDLPAPAAESPATHNIIVEGYNPSPESREERMARLREWAARDFRAALASVAQLPEGTERNDAVRAVCEGLAQTDPARAVEVAQTLQQPGAVVDNLVQQWAGSDVSGALAWVTEQPAGDQRDDAFQRVTFVLSQKDPTDAAAVVQDQMTPGPAQDEAIMTLINQWANQDLASAAKWVQNYSFRSPELQERAMKELEGIEQYKNALAAQ
jgi:hypothetical protein